MTENEVVVRARTFAREAGLKAIPVNLALYLREAKSAVHYDNSMDVACPGRSTIIAGKHHIWVNSQDSPERQRFTICHELGHIILGLPSEHDDDVPFLSYRRRPPNEVLCDVFAAELLLPVDLFKPLAIELPVQFKSLVELSERFKASLSATGSRFAIIAEEACAFLFVELGIVRYVSRSLSFQERGAWIPIRAKIPSGSVANELRTLRREKGCSTLSADEWLDDWRKGGSITEDVRHWPEWDQTLVLLSLDQDGLPENRAAAAEDDDWEGVEELDGILPWPDKKRRR